MLMLTSSVPSSLDNMLTIGLVALLALVVVIAVIRKLVSKKKAAAEVVVEEAAPAPAPVVSPTAPGSAGKLKIYDTPPKTAAMCMAIIADQLGKPLNELRFISIKEVK